MADRAEIIERALTAVREGIQSDMARGRVLDDERPLRVQLGGIVRGGCDRIVLCMKAQEGLTNYDFLALAQALVHLVVEMEADRIEREQTAGVAAKRGVG